MNELERRRLAAQQRYNAAQAAEVAARERGGDPIAIGKAKAEQAAALDEIAAVEQETRRLVAEGRL